MIPYGKQDINQADIDAVINVLKSDWLTQGPMVPHFEQAVAGHVGAEYAVAVNSATSALHLACLALGLGPGDWLWTSPNSFVASANCGLYCGAQVDFVDIDSQTYNMCVAALEMKLAAAERLGKLPKIVIPVHFAGQSCDMEAIHRLAQKYGFKVIEDASHAIGGRYQDVAIGQCQYSDITIFSFHPVKLITSGEGGMAVTNQAHLAEKMQLLRSHGITRDLQLMQNKIEGSWYYEQRELGFNYRMTDIQAALGHSQLGRLDEFVYRRQQLAEIYTQQLKELPLICPYQSSKTSSAFHLYVIQIDSPKHERKAVFEFLRQAEIGVNVHYIPIHWQPYYHAMGYRQGDFPKVEAYYRRAISIPMYPILTEFEQLKVINTLKEVLT